MNSLIPRLVLWCILSSCMAAMAAPPDVDFYGLIKEQRFEQGTGAFSKLAHHDSQFDDPRFRFQVFADLTSSNAVTNATIQLPTGALRTLMLSQSGDSQELQEDGGDTLLDFNDRFPSGSYILTLNTRNDGNKTITLNLTGDTYPGIPRISNYAAAQAVTATANFTVTWDAWAGGTVNDFVQLTIKTNDNTVFHSPEFGALGALNGTSTSFMIPANTLQPGQMYEVELFFVRATLDTTSYSGVTGVIGYAKRLDFDLLTTGGTDTNKPSFYRSTPKYGDGNVPVDAVIAFNFTERMQPTQSITWSANVNPVNFSYTWSADGLTLFCKYSTALPTSSQIDWTLNDSGFLDLAGNTLSFTALGNFTTSSSSATGATDVNVVYLSKGRGFRQTNSTPVALSAVGFEMSVDLTAPNRVTNGTLGLPNALSVPLKPDASDGDEIKNEAEFASQTDLDQLFPSGTYQVTLNTVKDGNKTFSLLLTGDSYPNAPTVNSFSSLQTVDPSNSLTVSWGAFSGGSVNDVIELVVKNDQGQEVFYSPDPGTLGSLNGTSNSIVVPTGTFSPGRKFEARLRFIKIITIDSSTYAGAFAVAAYASETEFEIMTTGSPILAQLSVLPPNFGYFQIRVTGEPNRQYSIQFATDLKNPNWQYTMGTQFSGTTGTFDVTDFSAQMNFTPFRFYRVKEGY